MLGTIKTKVVPLLQETLRQWQEDNAGMLAAAMAYYALFSLFPLLLIILSVVGFVLGSEDSPVRQSLRLVAGEQVSQQAGQVDANEQILRVLRESVSEQAAAQIEEILGRLNERRGQAGLIGFVTLLLAASGVFGALDNAFQIIWNTKDEKKDAPASGIMGTARSFVLKKLLAFALVGGCALLLLVSLLSGVVITALSTYTTALPGSGFFWQVVQFAVSLAILALVFMLLFKYLPDTPVAWRDVWLGAVLTAILFTILMQVSSRYIARTDYQAYGAVGGIMALLVWIFFSCQLLFLGGEFTQVYAAMFGSKAGQPDPKKQDRNEDSSPDKGDAPQRQRATEQRDAPQPQPAEGKAVQQRQISDETALQRLLTTPVGAENSHSRTAVQQRTTAEEPPAAATNLGRMGAMATLALQAGAVVVAVGRTVQRLWQPRRRDA